MNKFGAEAAGPLLPPPAPLPAPRLPAAAGWAGSRCAPRRAPRGGQVVPAVSGFVGAPPPTARPPAARGARAFWRRTVPQDAGRGPAAR